LIRKIREAFHMGGTEAEQPEQQEAFEATLPDNEDSHGTGELNVNSSTWAFVAAWADERIEKCRTQNDNPTLSERDTANLRGQIKTLKSLKGLPDADSTIIRGILSR